jgi:chromosome segregation protein
LAALWLPICNSARESDSHGAFTRKWRRHSLIAQFEQPPRIGSPDFDAISLADRASVGLEIMAKPPGKKPVTLSLLSGGEQALTALALIFAVFLTNPAPICVLDEVDAPLDDYNVERFCDLLDEMTRATDTRFIIITHNPITMARMNRLYGVTMAERGVSQLVSVDLEGAVKLREAS